MEQVDSTLIVTETAENEKSMVNEIKVDGEKLIIVGFPVWVFDQTFSDTQFINE